MSSTRARPESWVSLLHWAAVWGGLALFFGSWLVTVNRVEHRATTWDRALAIQLGSFLLWALLAVPMIALARRVPFESGRRLAALALRALLALSTALVHSAFQAALLAASLPADLRVEGWIAGFFHSVRFQLHFNLLIAALVLFADLALGWYRRSAERRVEAARLEENLVKARLTASRIRLRPRFLFGALATVRATLAARPIEAERLVLQLAALLRAVLESWRHPDSTVRDEIELASSFVDLERARLGARLDLAIDCEPGTLELELPSLLLVPLVDDATAGGAAAGGAVSLVLRAAADESESRVEVEVRAAGGALDPAQVFTEETLAVARGRLAEQLGAARADQLELATGEAGAARLILRLPPAAAARAERSDPIRPQEVLWSRS